MQNRRSGFTLVELLVVIGIIALLVGILLPSLQKARESANTLKCSANLRSIGQGLAMYAANYKGIYPNSYVYDGQSIAGGVQLPAAATNGYLHWSYLIYSTYGKTNQTVPDDAFHCPNMENGGLNPTNPIAGTEDAGQKAETVGIVDKQVARTSYTLNEAVCGRNKFVVGFQGAIRTYRFIAAASARQSAGTILATEFINDWQIVSDAPRNGGAAAVCKSHRPVHGFIGLDGNINMEKVAIPGGGAAGYRKATEADLMSNTPANYGLSATTKTRLDWVGHNHGRGSYDLKKTNFLYCDGHVETKLVKETLFPVFEWGQRMYSISPNDDLQ